MTPEALDSLISRLEVTARERPSRYVAAAIGVAVLGLLIVGIPITILLASTAAMFLVLAALILSGNVFVLTAIAKPLLVLAIPAWAMVRGTFAMLFARFPEPAGRELHRREAPKLFAALDEVRRVLGGPRVHKVLLTGDFNAAMVQHPQLGVLGWERNYLILGLPLLLVLSEKEALAVVAHEFGHLSGHHGRISGLIYRFRSAWERAAALAEEQTDLVSRLIARLFRWYTPYFNAYTFVLARRHEYVADQGAAEVAGRDNAANALIRTNIGGLFADNEYWPAMDRRAIKEPGPPSDQTADWERSVRSMLDTDRRVNFLGAALERETDRHDTHPALGDRLAALGVAADADAARGLEPPAVSAAQAWLGEYLSAIRDEFDALWCASAAVDWAVRHLQFSEQADRLRELEVLPNPDAAERWERVVLTARLRPDADYLPMIEDVLKADPNHEEARYERGLLLLEKGDESGIADLEAVMSANPEAILPACEVASVFYRDRDPEKAGHYIARWFERNNLLDAVAEEMSTLKPDAALAPHDLPDEVLEMIAANVRRHRRHVRRAYVLKRVSRTDGAFHDYVLAFEKRRSWFGKGGTEVTDLLAVEEYPMQMFIVWLGLWRFRRFRRIIRDMGVAPLALD